MKKRAEPVGALKGLWISNAIRNDDGIGQRCAPGSEQIRQFLGRPRNKAIIVLLEPTTDGEVSDAERIGSVYLSENAVFGAGEIEDFEIDSETPGFAEGIEARNTTRDAGLGVLTWCYQRSENASSADGAGHAQFVS